MLKISFSDGLAVAGIVSGIILVALDKAGKLKGPLPVVLLAVAALMTLPLAIGNPWVAEAASGALRLSRGMLLVFAVGLIYSALLMWISTDDVPPPQQPVTVLDLPAKQAYQRFIAEKTRRISSYGEGTFLQLKFAAMLGQKKLPRLKDHLGLSAELQRTNLQYEDWRIRNAKAEEDFQSAIAALKVSWPPSQELTRLIEAVKQPYRIHIDEPPPLEIEAEKAWLQEHNEELNLQFDKAVVGPLNALERYLDNVIERAHPS